MAAPAAAAAGGAGAAGVSHSLMPEVISTYGDEVDRLFYIILAITLVMLVLVFALFGIFVVKYRYQEGRRAVYTHGSSKLEWTWTAATAAVLIWLVFAQRETWIKIKQADLDAFKNPYLVRVFGEQFVWHFVYPGSDGKFEPQDVKDIFQGVNPVGLKAPKNDVYKQSLVVPDDVPVILEINSLGKYDQDKQIETVGVLHSFFQPNLRLKQDLVPFHPAKIWFQVKKGKTGIYEIACAELCGLGHFTMRADMKVLGDDELNTELGYDWKATPAKF